MLRDAEPRRSIGRLSICGLCPQLKNHIPVHPIRLRYHFAWLRKIQPSEFHQLPTNQLPTTPLPLPLQLQLPLQRGNCKTTKYTKYTKAEFRSLIVFRVFCVFRGQNYLRREGFETGSNYQLPTTNQPTTNHVRLYCAEPGEVVTEPILQAIGVSPTPTLQLQLPLHVLHVLHG